MFRFEFKKFSSALRRDAGRHRALWIAGLAGGLAFGCARVAVPQQPQPSQQTTTVDVAARSRDIVAHLNAVIQFYRSSVQPIQKAGEPNDVVYSEQAAQISLEVGQLAFQAAKAEAALLARYQPATAASSSNLSSEQQRMQTTEQNVEKRISDLKAQQAALTKQMASARAKDLPALRAQQKDVEGALNLASAMKDALEKIVSMSDAHGDTGLAADIDRLQSSVPELASKTKRATPQLVTLNDARSAGVVSQASVLFDLLTTRHTLDTLLSSNSQLHKQALDLRTPLSKVLRGLVQQGQVLSQQAGSATPTPAPAANTAAAANTTAAAAPDLTAVTTQFKALSAATVPLSQEIILLEQSQANLTAWQTSVNREYEGVLHALFLRIVVIAVALALIFGAGELWTYATNRYIKEIRRRRQFLVVRRIVVGFLAFLVVLFGFVTQFNSLATFAGFITAGIAVGLQTILLSVAAYFFIIGRYGVKVGDRITISGVTGDVIEVGIVRFYMMELAGSGVELYPTGRVAVFSNAVLFTAGTPLYKQIPGTEYAWHELIVKLTDAAEYKTVCQSVVEQVQKVYTQYRSRIEAQHRLVQSWMQATIDPPGVESRLQYNAGVFQLWVRFPVEIRQAAETDEQLTQALYELISSNAKVKSGIAATPTIQSSVRG